MMLIVNLAVLSEGAGGWNPFDPAQGGGFLWTLVIFVVALFPMWKIVMGPIANALEGRDELAARKITEAEKASRDAENARAEVEIALGEARTESQKVLAEARERATAREREIVEAANQKARAETEAALKTIQAEKEKAVAEIRDLVVDVSINAAGKVLERNVDTEDDRRLVASLVTQIEEPKA